MMRPVAPPGPSFGRGRISSATTIREVMTLAPHTIGSDQKLAFAHRIMRDHGLRHLPVLRGGELVGMLSERDLYLLETIAGVDVELETVEEAMSTDVYAARPEDTLRDVVDVMCLRKYGCAVVIDGSRLLGIFTATDALRYLADVLA